MASHFDTIVAPITGASRAAVAIVRLSGPDAWSIAREVFPAYPADPEPMRLYYGRFAHGDDGYLTLFGATRGYTSELSAECSIHGSPASVRALLNLAFTHGARMAEPGEFTQRAFLNGRIDLTQAEAVRDTIEAQTEAQLRAANRQREGALYRKISAVRGELVSIQTAIEASVDFSEEIGELDRAETARRLTLIIAQVGTLSKTAKDGRLLREGIRVALVGRPNAGKSSLLNALLGAERSIVTSIAGTTRDFVEESMEIDGFKVVLTDTAGLRATEDEIEQEGMRRARGLARQADLLFYLYDGLVGWTNEDQIEHDILDRPTCILATKCDAFQAEPEMGIPISIVSGVGIERVRQRIGHFAGNLPEVMISPRHLLPLANANQAIGDAWQTLNSDRPIDLATVGLREAIRHLGEITGETADPDIIQRIFHDFCIGK